MSPPREEKPREEGKPQRAETRDDKKRAAGKAKTEKERTIGQKKLFALGELVGCNICLC